MCPDGLGVKPHSGGDGNLSNMVETCFGKNYNESLQTLVIQKEPQSEVHSKDRDRSHQLIDESSAESTRLPDETLVKFKEARKSEDRDIQRIEC